MGKQIRDKAGVVAYRSSGRGGWEVLTVSSRRYPGTWVFPVGTVEQGESSAEAAGRECQEETGYVVKVGEPLAQVVLQKKKKTLRFTFFLATPEAELDEWEQDRQRRWVRADDLTGAISTVFRPVAERFLQTKLSGD